MKYFDGWNASVNLRRQGGGGWVENKIICKKVKNVFGSAPLKIFKVFKNLKCVILKWLSSNRLITNSTIKTLSDPRYIILSLKIDFLKLCFLYKAHERNS